MKKWGLLIFVIMIIAIGMTALVTHPAKSGVQRKIFSLNVEIADTKTKHIQGLSGRTSLPEGEGMLFVFDKPGYQGIWMKDMNFPIDIAWLNKDKQIIYIAHEISPETFPQIFYPPSRASFVLETNSGFFNSRQLEVGDVLETKED